MRGENIRTALKSIGSERRRSFLTILIIALGITALTGMSTATEALDESLKDTYLQLGSNLLTLTAESPEITKMQAERFLDGFDGPVSVSRPFGRNVSVRLDGIQTPPVLEILGTDPDFLKVSLLRLQKGRNFSSREMSGGHAVCVLGNGAAALLSAERDLLGKRLLAEGRSYRIIGILAPVGADGRSRPDNRILVPYTSGGSFSEHGGRGFTLQFRHSSREASGIPATARILFRAVRGLGPEEKENFHIDRSDAVLQERDENFGVVRTATLLTGIVTMVGAAAALMNMLLISLRERRREIGVRKALGATSARIRAQFLWEAVLLCGAGGTAGIVAGTVAGNVAACLMDADFVFPWDWILTAFGISLTIGLCCGFLPAAKAAALDPAAVLYRE